MRIRSKINKTTAQHLLSSKIKSFQIFFLLEDEDQSVEVVDADEIDFERVAQHLRFGGSIFIAPKTHRF
ncbi:MAG: hypothetical protein V1850_07475 [Candidatus Bathyarchaeota archaeon]